MRVARPDLAVECGTMALSYDEYLAVRIFEQLWLVVLHALVTLFLARSVTFRFAFSEHASTFSIPPVLSRLAGRWREETTGRSQGNWCQLEE